MRVNLTLIARRSGRPPRGHLAFGIFASLWDLLPYQSDANAQTLLLLEPWEEREMVAKTIGSPWSGEAEDHRHDGRTE
jgi:hypothetical protein